MNMNKIIVLFSVITFISVINSFGQDERAMPKIVEKDGRHTLLIEGSPYFILGGQVHNSSAWPSMMPQIWSAVEEMHLNTVEVPIYWEQIESQKGKFDFSLIDTLLNQSRVHKVHLILLWFATWKNGSDHYMPEWMKRDPGKYPNVINKNGKPVDSPSPNIDATMEADKSAFASVMKYLRETDTKNIVIMMQVENESGSWGSVRDYSEPSQKLFESSVPKELLKPELLKALHVPVITEGSWQKVFGERADEYFQAWSIARFVGQVAAAGKAEYSLPMYVNAALRDPISNPSATTYESGGPTDNVIPIWKIAAPALDLVAPDIYLSGNEKILKVIELYDRSDNALFVPEISSARDYAKYLYEIFSHGGIGYSPFGIDANGRSESETELTKRLNPFAQEYIVIGSMMRELAKWAFEGKIKAVVESDDHADQSIDLGSWQANVSFGSGDRNVSAIPNTQPIAKAMIIQLDENKFVLIGTLCRITFHPAGNNLGKAWQYLKVEEGQFEDGKFKMLRILNGDETDWGGPRFGSAPTVLQATLTTR
jgi:beta-galactosidase GanA